jgi:energy-coupling factor transporter ATP-binding protein EcfA2
MTVDKLKASPEKSILEHLTLDYRILGFSRNPFESVPVFSDLQPIPFNGYLKYYLGRLSLAVENAARSRPACVYLVGPSGSGKSAILKAFSRVHHPKGSVLPIYIRFPLAGGRSALFSELLRRLPIPLLKLIFYYARNNYSRIAQTYIGNKLFWASMSKDLWEFRERIQISPQYAIESIAGILLIALDLTDANRIALVLDEFEHAWARSTGAQKYNWEKSMVELFLKLGPKIMLVLPALPESVTMGLRPYMNMYDWKAIDLDPILKATYSNTVEINCSKVTLMRCIYSVLRREIINKEGERNCEILLSDFGNYTTIGEAIIDLRGKVLEMAYKKKVG